MTNSDISFQFSPRPEAQALQWDDLPPAVRSAVRSLLVLLDGDETHRKKKEKRGMEVVASSFLVNGERGTGKTTVLLSAKEAIDKPEDYFQKKASKDGEEENALTCAKSLHDSIIWLTCSIWNLCQRKPISSRPYPRGSAMSSTPEESTTGMPHLARYLRKARKARANRSAN